MQNDLISIIVPVFNLQSELPRCLDSVLAQSYSNIEIIVVDDGSSDGSADIMRRYAKKEPRIKPVFQENGGVTSARLHGVREASGQWIGFVDGDDEIEPDMYERLLKNAVTYQADISHCGYQMCFPDGRVNYFYNTGLLAQQDKITALKELLSGSRIEPGLCNKLFHKTLSQSLLHGETVPLDIKINEDLLMNYRLFSAAKQTVFEDWCPYHYIVRSTSASRAKLNPHKIYDPIRVKEIVRQDALTELHDAAQQAYINTCINTYHALLMEGTGYEDDLRKVHELLVKEAASFSLLGLKRKLMASMIAYTPMLYRLIYAVYSKFFQKKVYS
jgi:glycosyltransferase involved in cell wall biosynthesis